MGRFRATPYAKALFSVLRPEGPKRLDEALAVIDRIAQTYDAVPELGRAMVVPTVAPEVKTAILDEVLDTLHIEEPMRRFLHVIQRHYRMEQLDAIRDAFRDLVDRAQGRVRARVEVASPLDAGQEKAVIDALADMSGSLVVTEFAPRPELLAGFRARIGSTVYDGSLAGQLEQLRRQIQTAQR